MAPPLSFRRPDRLHENHPLVRDLDLSRIGIWEASDRIVGVIHPEHRMGKACFEVAPGSGDAMTGSLTTEGTPPEGTPPEGPASGGPAGGAIPAADAASSTSYLSRRKGKSEATPEFGMNPCTGSPTLNRCAPIQPTAARTRIWRRDWA